jgi:hypothetical protein
MENNEYKNLFGYEEVNTPEQSDTFEPQHLYGLNNRFIFDFSSYIETSAKALVWVGDTETTPTAPYSAGYLSDYLQTNQAYWRGAPTFVMQGQPSDGRYYFKNHRAIGQGIVNPPTLTYQDTPATNFIEDFTFNADTSNNPVYFKRVPVINKDLAFEIGWSDADHFRSGFFEFSVKTDNQNCIIGYTQRPKLSEEISIIDNKTTVSNHAGESSNEIKIEVKNGKLAFSYKDLGGTNPQSFELISNKTIADNQWHHIVINFGKKGILTKNFKKSNKRFIEFWVDAQRDLVDYSVLNKKQIFFPTIEWLFVNPNLTFKRNESELWDSYDTLGRLVFGNDPSIDSISLYTLFPGIQEFQYASRNGVWNSKGDSVAFSGSLYTFVSGVHVALNPKEIKLRYSLFINDKILTTNSSTALATMVSPTVQTNKKKALKLFWNNMENNQNGLELDNNYLVHSVSVTHQNKISATETYNLDLSNTKEIQYLKDVKAVFTDNINIFGPGKTWNQATNDLQIGGVQYGFGGILYSSNYRSFKDLDAVRWPAWNPADGYKQTKEYADYAFSDGALIDMPFSGIDLVNGDRILLTNQFRSRDNGIYVFNGYNNVLTRAEDSNSPFKLNNSVVRVVDGYYKNTSWTLSNNISSIGDPEIWVKLEFHPNSENINSQPFFTKTWTNQDGSVRLINLEQDLNIQDYDLIVFMNYPTNNEELKTNFDNLTDFEINVLYKNFIKSLENVCAQGASLYVSSPKLAQDLGIIKNYKVIDQMLETSDAQSAAISPFEVNEPADQYFDTHRINQYQLQTEVAGLTNKETYILTDFINYVPSNINEPQQYHAKYAYRQLGLKEGNQFFIPSLSLLKIADNNKLPGFGSNRRGTKELTVVDPNQINAGTIVTKLQNTYYQNGQVVTNPYDDDATTIIVHNNQTLNGQPITGKIFVNFIEDAYTMSRAEYNKAFIQVVPAGDINETTTTRGWQYSTSRLNRLSQRINIRELTEYGQTTSTNGGGGPFIQAQTNSSNGIIRSLSDAGKVDYQSDLYPTETEEIYTLQEIPVLSMTYLGLQWLAE